MSVFKGARMLKNNKKMAVTANRVVFPLKELQPLPTCFGCARRGPLHLTLKISLQERSKLRQQQKQSIGNESMQSERRAKWIQRLSMTTILEGQRMPKNKFRCDMTANKQLSKNEVVPSRRSTTEYKTSEEGQSDVIASRPT